MGILYTDIAIVAGEIAGLVFSTRKNGWWGQFIYFTQLSNLFLLAAAAVHAVCLLRRSVPAAVERCRYYAACVTALTFLVTVLVLIPWYGHPEYFLLETNGLFQHLLCPLLAAAGLPFLGEMKRKDSLIAVLPTLCYGALMCVLDLSGVMTAPYPFLQVSFQPWYMSVLWFAGIAAAAYGTAAGLRLLCGRKRRVIPPEE